MDHREVGRYWDANAQAWTTLARAGYDICRDNLNTPAFLAMLPPIDGLRGLDIGCGEGHNTRQLADRGGRMTGIDVASTFVHHAWSHECRRHRGIRYLRGSAVELPLADATFDFVTGFMSFMDIGETERVVGEAVRVLRPGGWLQFSLTHPCSDVPHRRKVKDDEGVLQALELSGYFGEGLIDVQQWIFGAAPAELKARYEPFSIPRFQRTLSSWINLLAGAGLVFEEMREPCPDAELLARMPSFRDEAIWPCFLVWRWRKR